MLTFTRRLGSFAAYAALLLISTSSHSAVDPSEVGTLPGTLSVDGGAANYQIGISVPSGVAGVEPELAVTYSSLGGGGLLGPGWAVSGMSAITRCGRNLELDGSVIGVEWQRDDRYCLDGQRLVLVSGSYGAAGSEYRTQQNAFARITAQEQAGNGPKWFKVETKAGQTLEYGRTNDARIEAHGRTEVYAWARNKLTDATGNNHLSYTYHEASGHTEFYPLYINYAGNQIEFIYRDVPSDEIEPTYLSGVKFKATKWLSAVISKVGVAELSRMKFKYEARSHKPDRLESVQACVGGETQCQKATQIDWYNFPGLVEDYEDATQWLASGYPTQTYTDSNSNPFTDASYTEYADFDADGILDVFAIKTEDHYYGPSKRITFKAYRSTGTQLTHYYTSPVCIDCKFAVGDMNADGKADLIRAQGNALDVALSTGSGFAGFVRWSSNAIPSEQYWYDDGNGNAASLNRPASISVTDFDGDGKGDIVALVRNAGWGVQDQQQLYLFKVSGTSLSSFYTSSACTQCQLRAGDVNADGHVDLLKVQQTNLYVQLGRRQGFDAQQLWNDSFPADYDLEDGYKPHSFVLRDINKDGLKDINFDPRLVNNPNVFMMSGATLESSTTSTAPVTTSPGMVPLSSGFSATSGTYIPSVTVGPGGALVAVQPSMPLATGSPSSSFNLSSFQYLKSTGAAFKPGGSILDDGLADLNGDGTPDQVFISAGGQVSVRLGIAPTAENVTKITDSLGSTLEIEYGVLSDPAVHELAGAQTFPVFQVRGPLSLVTRVKKDNGTTTPTSTSYRYAGALSHLKGHGFLGFARITATDDDRGLSTWTYYRQDYPYVGQSYSVITAKTDGTVLSDQWMNYAHQTQSFNEQRPDGTVRAYEVIYPYVASQDDRSYTLGGTHVSTVSTHHSNLDSYGNIGTVQVTTSLVANGESYTKTTQSTYANDVAKWHLGRLTETSVTHSGGNGASITRKSAFTYTPDGLLLTEVVEPDQAAFKRVTTHSYDSYGNKVKVAVNDVSGNETRVTETLYGAAYGARFPTKVINELGHFETRQYNSLLGKVSKLIGPNALETTWQYDSWGRKTHEKRADGTASLIKRSWTDPAADVDAPASAVYHVTEYANVLLGNDDNESNLGNPSPPATVYFDRLGREIRKVTEGFDGSKIYQDTQHDHLGRPYRKSLPYYSGQTAYWLESTYDLLGRVVSTKHYTQAGPVFTTFAYDGQTVTEINALGQKKVTRKNALGKVAEVIEKGANNVVLGRVTYDYDAVGNLLRTHQFDGATVVTVEMTYDTLGHKTSMNDPDMGQWSYVYNGFGELVSQTDAKGQVTTMEYDGLGRMVLRLENDGVTVWKYDKAQDGIGKLEQVSQYDVPGSQFTGVGSLPANKLQYRQTPSYDSNGRVFETDTLIDGETYTSSVTFDVLGRVLTSNQPGGIATTHTYNAKGYLVEKASSIGPSGTNVTWWEANSRDAAGRLDEYRMANGQMATYHVYDPSTGQLTAIGTENTDTNAMIRHLSYTYDSLDNVTSREDVGRDIREDFQYDGLNRLTQASVSGNELGVPYSASVNYSYDALGNMLTKSDVSGMPYAYGNSARNLGGNAGPHAIRQVLRDGLWENYLYDNNGSITSGGGRTVTWTSFNKPSLISRGGKTVAFEYGPDRARYKKVNHGDGQPVTTHYLGKSYERVENADGTLTHKYFLYAEGQLVATHTQEEDVNGNINAAQDETQYMHRDSLGSIDTVTNEHGTIIERLAYGPFGARRGGNWQKIGGLSFNFSTNRGFTGHEHLDDVGLIHMNGRVYDPELGRFLSADPHVQAPTNSQSYNRYSYVLNNPLKYTDPSGYFFKKLFKSIAKFFKKYGRMVVIIGMSWITAGATLALTKSYILAGAAAGFVSGFVSTGSLKGAIQGAIIGGVSAGVAQEIAGINVEDFGALEEIGRDITHGVAQGVISEVSGGDFKSGFLGATLGHFAGRKAEGWFPKEAGNVENMLGRTAVAAIAGGTAAGLGGGKFANGAVSAAFAHLFNNETSDWDESWDRVDVENLPDPTHEIVVSKVGWAKGPNPLRIGATGSIDGELVMGVGAWAGGGAKMGDIVPEPQSLFVDVFGGLYVKGVPIVDRTFIQYSAEIDFMRAYARHSFNSGLGGFNASTSHRMPPPANITINVGPMEVQFDYVKIK